MPPLRPSALLEESSWSKGNSFQASRTHSFGTSMDTSWRSGTNFRRQLIPDLRAALRPNHAGGELRSVRHHASRHEFPSFAVWICALVPSVSDLMANADSRITIHMAASLDGFIARQDGSVDWLETTDEFLDGDTMDPAFVQAFLATIDCYVMGSRTYETAMRFDAKGLGWAYGDKPTVVLTSRQLPRIRDTVEFHSGDLEQFVNARLRPRFRNIWFVGGGVVAADCVRLGLADELRYSILPILIGNGISFFEKLDRDVALHLVEVKPYRNGMVELRYELP